MTPLERAGEGLPLDDPDRVLAAWRSLLASNHHLHGPEAAAMLGVPEAALLAASVGHGAVSLRADLPSLLALMPGWGKVLLAVRCGLGVELAIVEPDCVEFDPAAGTVRLSAARHAVLLDAHAAASCYLFEERDAHGHTFSVNWFDGAGDCAGRVFLISKSGRARALPALEAQAAQEQSRVPPRSTARARRMPSEFSRADAMLEAVASGAHAAVLLRRAVLASKTVPEVEMVLEGIGGTACYRGGLATTMDTPPTVHAVDAACKLHARPPAVEAAHRWRSGSPGATGLRFDSADGGRLSLAALGPGGGAWVERLLAEVA